MHQNHSFGSLKAFIAIVAFLTVISFIFVYSSSSVYALERFGSSSYFIQKQMVGLGMGVVAALILALVPLNVISALSPVLLMGTLGVTAMVLVPGLGVKIHGATRWVSIAGFSFQPSELLKYILIVYVAHVIEHFSHRKSALSKAHAIIFGILGLTSVLLLAQPDFGMMVTLSGTVVLLWFIAFVNWRYLIALALGVVPLFGFLIYYEPYRLRRLLTYLDPWSDPQGAGFQVIQSLIAIGSGGFWGVGISYSRQKFFYLPMQHTDFIVSIIAEESGFIGIALLLLAFMLLLYFGMKIAWSVKNTFATYIILGYVFVISLQAIINFCVAAGLFPTKGIGLPFVSYGNSSLFCSIAMLGIIARSVAEDSKHAYFLYPQLRLH